tara:strand:- start:295 stop:486 length:192 start_codon:yes stop_codon:yes gene_type:complete
MNSNELGVLFGGISSILAVLIYFTKNIKESSCCGSKCKQVVIDDRGNICSKDSIINISQESEV